MTEDRGPGALAIREGRPADVAALHAIWREAVDATHDFLSPDDRAALDLVVGGLLPGAPAWVAVRAADRALGFMLLDDAHAHMDALFVDPACHRRGVGRAMVHHAVTLHPGLTVDVNEQNAGATAFYERLGFRRVGRSARDGQGRPYPLLHLAFDR